MPFVIVYAKIIQRKRAEPKLEGIYFYGIAPTQEEAANLARTSTKVINKDVIIIPKVVPMTERGLMAQFRELERIFSIIIHGMLTVHSLN